MDAGDDDDEDDDENDITNQSQDASNMSNLTNTSIDDEDDDENKENSRESARMDHLSWWLVNDCNLIMISLGRNLLFSINRLWCFMVYFCYDDYSKLMS